MLCYLPEFRAMTKTASNPLPGSFVVKALSDCVGSGDEERLLCLVRVLRFSLYRLKTNSSSSFFFVLPSNPSRPISENALSCFLRECNSDAQAVLGYGREVCNPRSPSIRGVLTSFSFMTNWFLKGILEVACWKYNSLFF